MPGASYAKAPLSCGQQHLLGYLGSSASALRHDAEPTVSLDGISFAEGWQQIHRMREDIMVPAKCTACPVGNACDQCAAVCYAESGCYTEAPEFMCQITGAYLDIIRRQLDEM